jgi:sugar (pentulose or hexulose) kinase
MPIEVIAIFDIGKTNKKFLLFNEQLKLIYCEEEKFAEIKDDDGFACDDIDRIELWMLGCLTTIIHDGNYNIKALNFTTYGASLMFLDSQGERITPIYNYLKSMPDSVLDGFYSQWGGIEEFSRNTASPALGMLNSGLQALWLKKQKPDIFRRVSIVAHFPQYLSYFFTHHMTSEHTSIGCHTAMWDFDRHQYHPWLSAEGITVPQPVAVDTVTPITIEGQLVKTGIGIHDSSASLVPYFKSDTGDFVLISTGTWGIFMNPFNKEPLTREELSKDTLCYMSIRQKQVKSSRFFMGHIHDVQVELMTAYFGLPSNHYKKVKANIPLINQLSGLNQRVFFRNGVPGDYKDTSVDLAVYESFDEVYHRFMYDMVDLCIESLMLVISKNDKTGIIYVTGGFARNDVFMRILAARLVGKQVCTSEIDNATALGAAMVIYHEAFEKPMPAVDLGLKEATIR